jgi:hypothetical protein
LLYNVKISSFFKRIREQPTDLAFYDCPKAAVIYEDLSKGLRAAVAAKAASDIAGTTLTDKVISFKPSAILRVSEAASKPVLVKLQLCEWHAVEASKRRLVAASRYKKDCREEIVELI